MTILAFVILGSLIALGSAPQTLLCLGMASFWALDVHPSIYALGAMWIALWVGNMPGLALSAVSGIADWNANQIDDWAEKFKPSWWVMQRFIRMGIHDAAILGAIGTATRYMLFIPAVCIAQGWNGIWMGFIAAVGAGFYHWLAGNILRGTKYAGYAVVIAEGASAGLIGLVVIV